MLGFVRFFAVAIILAMGLEGAALAAEARVAITVNNQPITDQDISARAALIRLERRGNSNSARRKLAADELIDEKLMLAEAERLKIEITNAQVAAAYLDVARNLKLSEAKLSEALLAEGVNPNTLKDRLRASSAWSKVTQGAIAFRVQISDLELEKKAAEELQAAVNYDYILKEVRFIIPQGSKVSSASRTAQANQFRKSFQGCDTAVDLSLSYTDVAVIDVGRRHSTQLPDAMSDELKGLNVGNLTKPRVVAGGVSMLAICSKNEARDTAFVKNKLEREVGTEKLRAEADQQLAKLRERAAIFYK